MKAILPLVGALVLLRPGVGKCEPQPAPLCTDPVRQDAGKVAPCSGSLVANETFADCLSCVDFRDNPCIGEKADLANAQALLKAERDKHAQTEAARLACEVGCAPVPEPLPPEWYEKPLLWGGVAVVVGSVVGAFVTDDHPAWFGLGGFGLGLVFAEAVR